MRAAARGLRRGAALCAALALLATGCQSYAWSYSPEVSKFREPRMARTVAVPPAVDERGHENSNRQGLCVIPLVPWGPTSYARPERTDDHVTTRHWDFVPGEDIAKAVAAELQASGLFRAAFFTTRFSEGDLVLRLTLRSTQHEGKILSYGLSVYGPLLWVIGFPAGTVSNELALDFALEDRMGRRLWSRSCAREWDEGWFWIYAPPSDFQYDRLLKDMLVNEVLPALEKLPPQP